MRLALRAHALNETMLARSGLGEGRDILMHVPSPPDHRELMGYLLQDQGGPMFDAQTVVWMYGTDALADPARAVIDAVNNVVVAQSTLADRQQKQLRSRMGRWKQLERDPKSEEAAQKTVEDLGLNIRAFPRAVAASSGVPIWRLSRRLSGRGTARSLA